jgi:hypothetical protein
MIAIALVDFTLKASLIVQQEMKLQQVALHSNRFSELNLVLTYARELFLLKNGIRVP